MKFGASMKNYLSVGLLLISFGAQSNQLSGSVVRVLDGDTVDVLTNTLCEVQHYVPKGGSKCINNKEQIRVRFAFIDAPESKQPFGNKSKQFLANLVMNKVVSIKDAKRDVHGRVLGNVYVSNVWINKEMVSNGMAWVYRQYAKNSPLIRIEEEASRNKFGLWALPEQERVAPWIWRKNAKSYN
jgi:endonuclease YncB( thermonuclease family)